MKSSKVEVSIKRFADCALSADKASKVKGGNSENVEGTEIVIIDTLTI